MTSVTTRQGEVRGFTTGTGIQVFLGIPYAAPPVGPDRFRPPRPAEPWTGPRDATRYGPTAPQKSTEDGPLGELGSPPVIPGDDYLNLNVWTPDPAGRAPVMVFVHGGSFTSGSGALSTYDGTRFARDGVVLVTINYRLGADGFLWFGEGAPNLGLLDQVAALTWVRDNIGGFGGDPGQVTVFGESAGAMSVCSLLAMPAANGLFHRAIAQSGAGHSTISPATARLVGTRLAAVLGVEPTREAIAGVPMEKLLAAQSQIAEEVVASQSPRRWGEVARNLMPFEPVVDGEVLPAAPVDRLQAGVNPQVDLLIGTNSEEARLFLVPTGAAAKIKNLVVHAAALRYRLPPLRGVRTYRAHRPEATPGDLLAAIMTDWYYWIPALRLAEARPGTHVYECAWRSPAFGHRLGACHAIELPFVFDRLDDPAVRALLGDHPPQPLADAMHRAWVGFATTGDPGWPAYAADHRVVMRFDTDSATTVDDRAAERVLWDGRR
ncbi:carboxylesterase family protein [Amycolatopsis sp. PS_44_ISF1]|uniref:carboxylesterase/lipase family protein n=1 Tax=Amycolatopsis sp. PS_44_ISF1 TaxID=2974917 RepID=UPI0028DF9521|nr:carboxylesterase family protein [Amycolatopsis sp. PS_44_ISF1]MDT8911952.1 carboxylesterase family protein [Amycolatopsis sp. PS_44_ISF1]